MSLNDGKSEAQMTVMIMMMMFLMHIIYVIVVQVQSITQSKRPLIATVER